MKKIFLFAAAVVTLGLASCDIDNVENIGEMSTSEFPKTDGDIEAVLAGVYQNLNTTHANPQCSFLYAACLASDDQLGSSMPTAMPVWLVLIHFSTCLRMLTEWPRT